MTEPLISVIVPIYKVEQYLRQCVDSILAQTYTNLEVILVDDGSPDGCGAICDDYATKDARVVVIHKENGGLSDARNAGLDIARGEYIGFVDSDDWIEPNMYEGMLNNMIKNGCEISVCGIRNSYSAGDVATNIMGEVVIMTPEEAVIESFISQKVLLSACNKLLDRRIFCTVRYPYGRLYEDLFVIVEVLVQANKIAVNATPKYHYRQRQGSIIHGKYSMKHFVDSEAAFQKATTDIVKCFPHLSELARAAYLRGCYNAVYLASGIASIRSSPKYIQTLQTLRSSIVFVLCSKCFSINEKVKALLLGLSVTLFRWMMTLRIKASSTRNKVEFD